MSVVLPSQIDYSESLPSLPADTQSIFVKSLPINGSSFTAGSQIMLDFINRGFLVPDSVYLSFKLVATTDASGTTVLGTPIYTPFSTSQVQVGSQTVETIANYNIVMNTIVNSTMDVAQKYGNQAGYGWSSISASSSTAPTLAQLDNRYLSQSQASAGIFLSAPLMNILTNSERLLPLGMMPQVRLVLTADAISNMFTAAGAASGQGVVSAYTISNVELRYRVIDMPEAENAVKQMGQKIYIKSQSFASSSQILPSGANGYNELVFNSRFASLKGLIAVHGATYAGAFARNFESFDITSGNGEYSFSVGGQIFPQAPISTSQNKATALMELKNCFGSIYEKTNSQSINSVEYGFNLGDTTTFAENAKLYIGVSTSKMDSHSLLTGISTQNSPITVRYSLGTPTPQATNICLMMNYDALWEVDLVNRQTTVKT